MRLKNCRRRRDDPGRPALIVGAGDTAKLVAKELIANPRLGFEPIGFVDDDPTKQNHMLLELPIMGTLSAIKGIVEQHGVSELIIAMPSARGDVVRKGRPSRSRLRNSDAHRAEPSRADHREDERNESP